MAQSVVRPASDQDRVLDALRVLGRAATTEEIMQAARDTRPAVYGALNNLMKKGIVQRGRSGATQGGVRKAVRWRIKPVTLGG